jgi:hypothetical protein
MLAATNYILREGELWIAFRMRHNTVRIDRDSHVASPDNTDLETRNAFRMLANCVGLRNADAKNFTQPANIVPAHSQSLPERPPALNHTDYDTKFWDFDEWKAWCNSTEGRGMIKSRGSVPFLEDASGDPLTSTTVDAIRRTMRRLFEMLASKDIAPPSWGRLSEQAYLLFHIGVGMAHPELRFCSNDWKANELAKNVYSAWRTARRRAKARVKGVKPEELDQDDLGVYAGDDEDQADDRDVEKKRTAPDDVCITKRRKLEPSTPSSSSSSGACTPSSEPQEIPIDPVPTPSPPPQVPIGGQPAAPVPRVTLKNPLYIFIFHSFHY